MAAFDKVLSGIPDLDITYDFIRLGDNVVWQVDRLEEFSAFMLPFAEQAIKDGRKLIYVRFADHPPLLSPREGLRIEKIPLSHRFENFTVKIRSLIESEGRDAFYIFDCLSELQTAWSTDLMMGNFFKLTCPFLFKLDTVAFFPIIRGKHAFDAVAKIRDTTQLFSEVYSADGVFYVRPLKVWSRYSGTMFMPHRYDPSNGSFSPLTDGLELSLFYQLMNEREVRRSMPSMDHWDRFFAQTMDDWHRGHDVSEACDRMCRIMMTRDERLIDLVTRHFSPRDYFGVKARTIGTGLIGGKACGMLLARKIIQNLRPELYARLEPHDSFYIGSDVFYSYIVDNDFWDLRIKQRTRSGYFSYAQAFADRIMEGSFSAREKDSFRRLLDYYGSTPIIVRSSSILEDGFGNAFAGKYESVFCANTGSPEERLADFERACKIVYASTMSRSALDYRLRRGMDGLDEQMGLLVQRVSGSFFGSFFMPCAAGVGYSYSPYKFIEAIDQKAGMLRLVMGLGTGAVDRTQGSYPRLVSLDKPLLTAARNIAEKHTFSQRMVDVVNTVSKEVEHWDFERVTEKIPAYLVNTLLEHDTDTEQMLRDMGQYQSCMFVSCEGIVSNKELMNTMSNILSTLQSEYNYPVDIEYTINLSQRGDFIVNLLQCRPLQVITNSEEVTMPESYDKKDVLFECRDASMGLSEILPLDVVVTVDPAGYFDLPYSEKYKVSSAISAVNWALRSSGKKMLLMAPGRIGTSSPELGVPTSFADISAFSVICEVDEQEHGYRPELSYGSHFFQDLVESQILYTAIFHNDKTETFDPTVLRQSENRLGDYLNDAEALSGIVKVYHTDGELMFYHDIGAKRVLCLKKQ